MGVSCDICVNEPLKGSFDSGDSISGVLKYNLDENVKFNQMVVSLKGVGRLTLTKNEGIGKKAKKKNYYNKEDYVNIVNTVESNEKGKQIDATHYEKEFFFRLPEKIPPSLNYVRGHRKYKVNCNIVYYVSVEFKFCDGINKNKRFSKILKMISKIQPRLLMTPSVYIESKKLFKLIKSHESIITIRASIQNSIVEPGDKVNIFYEVSNDSNITVKAIETKLTMIYIFNVPNMCGMMFKGDVKNTQGKTGPIKSGNILRSTVEIDLPPDVYSLDFCKFVSRDYSVVITAVLPLPHSKLSLEIPIQVGNKLTNGTATTEISEDNVEKSFKPPRFTKRMGGSSKNIRGDAMPPDTETKTEHRNTKIDDVEISIKPDEPTNDDNDKPCVK
ncbi:unnamed protein product [Chilo suppressalis]|uniref:Arrestin C-terminal-like domain-containing protein n=1 Tax=Chilo suppressalis TaxID=168631 RepID=A0ABN8BBW0_CHISP|nr:unnamed protein product [Chilo suppressalis]